MHANGHHKGPHYRERFKPVRAKVVIEGHMLRSLGDSIPQKFWANGPDSAPPPQLFEPIKLLSAQGIEVLIPEAPMVREAFIGCKSHGNDVMFLRDFLPVSDPFYRRGQYLARQITHLPPRGNIHAVRADEIDPKAIAGLMPEGWAEKAEHARAYVRQWHDEIPGIMKAYRELPNDRSVETNNKHLDLKEKFRRLVDQDIAKDGFAAAALEIALDAQRRDPDIPVFVAADGIHLHHAIDAVNTAAGETKPHIHKLNLLGLSRALADSNLLGRFGIKNDDPLEFAKSIIARKAPQAITHQIPAIDTALPREEAREQKRNGRNPAHPFSNLVAAVIGDAPEATALATAFPEPRRGR